jgi:hypothetical protein
MVLSGTCAVQKQPFSHPSIVWRAPTLSERISATITVSARRALPAITWERVRPHLAVAPALRRPVAIRAMEGIQFLAAHPAQVEGVERAV